MPYTLLLFFDGSFLFCFSMQNSCIIIVIMYNCETAEQLFDVEPRNKADDFYPLDMRGKEY